MDHHHCWERLVRLRIGTMFKDILRSATIKPATQKYPFERKAAPSRLRGKLTWDPERCSGCGLCAKDCPSHAIEIIILDRTSKRFVMRYRSDRCTFCAQCVVNCRFKCIEMDSEQWELAALSKQEFEIFYGNEIDVDEYLDRFNYAHP